MALAAVWRLDRSEFMETVEITMLCHRVVNSGVEEKWTNLCYILEVGLTGFGKGLNVGSEKKSHLPTCHLFWDVSVTQYLT